MKVAQVPVYLDAKQMLFIREDAQEAVLAADADLEVTMQIANLHARHLARRAISTQRDIYVEIVSKLDEAEQKLNCGEYELRESD
nr:MAG TPA: hypothetical protein [Caudoviricetes sp.]